MSIYFYFIIIEDGHVIMALHCGISLDPNH